MDMAYEIALTVVTIIQYAHHVQYIEVWITPNYNYYTVVNLYPVEHIRFPQNITNGGCQYDWQNHGPDRHNQPHIRPAQLHNAPLY